MTEEYVMIGARDEFRNGLFSWADGSLMKQELSTLGTDFTAGTGMVEMKTGTDLIKIGNSNDNKRFLCTTDKGMY